GLKVWTVRFGAALWGIADLIAIAIVAAELIDLRAAAIAAMLVALSPWHLVASRFGHEAITASATISWAVAVFLAAIRRQHGSWLIASGLLFGISLYSYSIARLATPLLMVALAALFRREIRAMARAGVAAVEIFALVAIPQIWTLAVRGAATQAHFRQLSVLSQPDGIWIFLRNWLASFGPAFLLGGGSRLVRHSGGLPLLWPSEAILAALGLAAILDLRWRKAALLLAVWVAIAAVPGALIAPAPTPHPLHDLLMAVPLSLLAALGTVFVLDLSIWTRPTTITLARTGCAVLGAAAAILVFAQGIGTAAKYFSNFSDGHEWLFQYGAQEVITQAERLAPPGSPIVIPLTFNQPYIYVLFFNSYPPRDFFSKQVVGKERLFGSVLAFDRYRFGDPYRAYRSLPHGVFVFPKSIVVPDDPMQAFAPPGEKTVEFPPPPAFPAATIASGRDAFSIVVK
ncbi:MAG TPA: glycosyltransferase family 39 protein, partial [Candidatus Binataceae bacterium]|nr:glycosyltransferase family 39 protein [Candidatus Binataceae bacterium]